MIIDLNKQDNNYLDINEKIEIDLDILNKAGIIRLENASIVGRIYKLDNDIYNINAVIKGTMILLCDLSLEEVKYPFEAKINNNFSENEVLDEENEEKIEENVKIIENTLDIFPIVWENIILEKPRHIVKENVKVKTSGDGWELSSSVETKNNGLEGLKNLLDMEEER